MTTAPGVPEGTGPDGAGPLAVGVRATAPDLARGLMLALIALANVHLFLVTGPGGFRGYPAVTAATSVADRVVTAVQIALVDARAYPLFAALVGYGLVRLAARHPPSVVRRRGLVLLAIGAAHGILLFPGDIIGAYGLVALVLGAVLVSASPRGLLIVAAVLALFSALLGAGAGFATAGPSLPSLLDPSWVGGLGERVVEWVNTTIFSALFTAPAALVGGWVARAGVLDDPGAHRRLLVRWTVLGLSLGGLAGLPLALAAAGWWRPPILLGPVVGVLHAAGGYAGALGWLGLIGLLAARVAARGAGGGARPGLLARAGTWSMSCYVAQSVVFCALFAAWAGGPWSAASGGRGLGVAAASGLALVVWAVTVAVAGLLARRGYRGPLESVVRRLTYPAA